MYTIKHTFKGITYLFPRQMKQIRIMLHKITSIKSFHIEGDNNDSIEQVITIQFTSNNTIEEAISEAFSIGMLIQQTILLNQ